MYNKNVIFDYYVIDSIVHRVNPVVKILSLLFILIVLIISNSTMDMIIINLFVFMLVVFSDISIKIYSQNLNALKIFLLLVFILGFIIGKDIVIGILWGLKVIDLILFLSVIVMTSSFSSIVYGVESFFSPFKNIINVNNFALNVGLFSKFIIILYNERIRISNSKELRGILYKDMNIWNKVKSFFDTIFLGYRNCINKINKIKMIMKVRNYNSFSTRSNYRLNKFGKIDTILVGINVVILILVIVY